jgi:hypothetical protein
MDEALKESFFISSPFLHQQKKKNEARLIVNRKMIVVTRSEREETQ